jgi:protein SCO1/2/putative membrane protein
VSRRASTRGGSSVRSTPHFALRDQPMSYRTGWTIVVSTVLLALAACVALVGRPKGDGAPRAAEAGGDIAFPLGSFRLVERSGRDVTETDFADRVCVASFVFTRCPLSCPRISSVMKGLQGNLAGTAVQLVSITVDPEHDTPPILSEYATRFGADRDRWWFLTGRKDDVLALIRERFKLGVEPADDAAQKLGAEAFSHSERLALVDRGVVVGYFSSTDPASVTRLVAESSRRAGPLRRAPAWARALPPVNAGLNATCAALLAIGWGFIRSGRWRAHAATMIAAVVVSALFLTCYLVYHYHAGSVPYRGVGPARVVYFTILISHTLLATFGVVPLVAITVWQALRRRFDRHARIARVAFPIWMYVSITGVVIYLMLYQLPPPSGG